MASLSPNDLPENDIRYNQQEEEEEEKRLLRCNE